jgi:hypothetical protein
MRSASVLTRTVALKGDFNTTVTIEVIGVPPGVTRLQVNGADTPYTVNSLGNWEAQIKTIMIKLYVPDFRELDWKTLDTLPELSPSYNDSMWRNADLNATANSKFPLLTPTSLYASDYGFHTGVLVYRGHFVAKGTENQLRLWTFGGQAFGYSLWLNSTFVGSWAGIDKDNNNNATWTLPNLKAGENYVATVVIDNMGLDQNWVVGTETMKAPRGIRSYSLMSANSSTSTNITWKLTGNLGGEDFADAARGPLNEGGLFAERNGYHLPGAPAAAFKNPSGSPFTGLSAAGIAFYSATFDLAYPADKFDIPIAFAFANDTSSVAAAGGLVPFRAFLYVNGWQFGRYTSNVGPQTSFPVPEGILNYNGTNTVGLVLWALDKSGAKVPDFFLSVGNPVMTGRERVELVESPGWVERKGAY